MWFSGKSLEGNVQLAISEMKISFPKNFGPFNFQLKVRTDQILLGDKKHLFKQSLYVIRSLGMSLKGFLLNLLVGRLSLNNA